MTRAVEGNPEKAVPGSAAADGRAPTTLPSTNIRENLGRILSEREAPLNHFIQHTSDLLRILNSMTLNDYKPHRPLTDNLNILLLYTYICSIFMIVYYRAEDRTGRY